MKRFQCPNCPKWFYRYQGLGLHFDHARKRPWVCNASRNSARHNRRAGDAMTNDDFKLFGQAVKILFQVTPEVRGQFIAALSEMVGADPSASDFVRARIEAPRAQTPRAIAPEETPARPLIRMVSRARPYMTREKILDFIRENGPVTCHDIASLLGRMDKRGLSNASARLATLTDQRWIVRDGKVPGPSGQDIFAFRIAGRREKPGTRTNMRKKGEAQRLVIDALSTGPANSAEVGDATGMGKGAASAVLSVLFKQGHLERRAVQDGFGHFAHYAYALKPGVKNGVEA